MKIIESWKALALVITVLLIIFQMGCATVTLDYRAVQDAWKKLTPDQQARVIINELQDELNGYLTSSRAYIRANPKHESYFREKVLPVFKLANNAIGAQAILQRGTATPDQVYAKIQPLINEMILLMVNIGWIKNKQ